MPKKPGNMKISKRRWCVWKAGEANQREPLPGCKHPRACWQSFRVIQDGVDIGEQWGCSWCADCAKLEAERDSLRAALTSLVTVCEELQEVGPQAAERWPELDAAKAALGVKR